MPPHTERALLPYCPNGVKIPRENPLIQEMCRTSSIDSFSTNATEDLKNSANGNDSYYHSHTNALLEDAGIMKPSKEQLKQFESDGAGGRDEVGVGKPPQKRKRIKFSRCPKGLKFLCEVCSKEDCMECTNCK